MKKGMVSDKIGGRPVDITKEGSEIRIIFHPIAKNAQNPKANSFTLKISASDLEKLKKHF